VTRSLLDTAGNLMLSVRAFLYNLTLAHIVKAYFAIYGNRRFVTLSKDSATGHYPELAKSIPRVHILFL
jgi:hypothetical protein